MSSFPLQTVLELACAAHRENKDYIKEMSPVFDSENTVLSYKHPNKDLMLYTLGEKSWNPDSNSIIPKPALLCTNLDDRELATDMQKYFRRLAFKAIEGTDQFMTDLNVVLNMDNIPVNKLGFIACLPSMYKREYAKTQFEKRIKDLTLGFLGEPDAWLEDLDSEIIESKSSKNYDAYNVYAIIDNKMAHWMSKTDLKLGPCVVLRGKIKAHSTHWKFNNEVTRMSHVKAFQ